MSKKNKKDIQSDDAAKENSEFESFDMIEETIEISITEETISNQEFEISGNVEKANQVQEPHISMNTAEFEKKLTDFFTKHKKSKLGLVSRIAFEFKGHEDIVLEHLHNKYVLGLIAEKPKKKTAHASGGHAEHHSEGHTEHHKNIESADGVKPKSKKKLVIAIVVVVLLAGLGVTGFLMKDKLMGKGHETEHAPATGHGAAKTEAGGENHAAHQPAEEAVPKAEANDSTKTTTNDSAHTH